MSRPPPCLLAVTVPPTTMQKKMRLELADGKLKDLLLRIVAKLSVNAPSPFFVGDSITIADLQVIG